MKKGPFKTDMSVVGARYRVNLPLFKLSEQAGQLHTLHNTTTMLMTKFPLTEIFVIPSASVLYFGTKEIASTDFCNNFSTFVTVSVKLLIVIAPPREQEFFKKTLQEQSEKERALTFSYGCD